MARIYTYDNAVPGFLVDPHSMIRNSGRQIAWNSVGERFRRGVEIVKLSAAASADDTALAVDALPVDIPAGTMLYFQQAKEFALVTAEAAAGATALTVQALPSALEDNDEAYFGSGAKTLPAGTIMSETAGGQAIPRQDSSAAKYILLTSAAEDDESEGVGYAMLVGGVIYSELLPEAGHASIATFKTELASAGCRFNYETYADDRAS